MSWNDDLERRHYERQEEQQSRGGQNFLPWQMDKVTFVKGDTFYIRILRPVDSHVYTRKYHWPKGLPPISCTEDHPAFYDQATNKGQCSLCTIFDKKDRAKQKKEDVLEVIDFRFFHVVPDESKGGDAQTVERCIHDEPDNDIRNNRCHLCNNNDPEISKRYFGGHKVMELKEYQYNQVWAAHEKLTNTCISVVGEDSDGPIICGKKNYLLTFLCRHCEEILLDDKEVQRMAPLAQDKYKRAKQTCTHCGKADWPYAIYACESGHGRTPTPMEIEKQVQPAEGEHWVIRGSMFDKVLEVTVACQEKAIKGQREPITLYNLNVSTGEDWSSVYTDLSYFGFDDEQIEKLCEPWDLADRYRPSWKLKPADFSDEQSWVDAVLAEQAETVGRPNPFAGGSGGARSAFSGEQGGAPRRSFRS